MTWPFEDKVLNIQGALKSVIEECQTLRREFDLEWIQDCAPKDISWELQGCLHEVSDLIKKYRAEAIEAAEWLNPRTDDADPGPSQEQRS